MIYLNILFYKINLLCCTGYVTEAERFGNSFVAEYYLNDEVKQEIKQVLVYILTYYFVNY